MLELALAVAATAPSAHAAARSEVAVDGGRVIVEGGSAQSVASTGDGHVIDVDGLEIRIEPGRISVDGEARPLPDYRELRIRVDDGRATITVDGRPL